MEAFSIVTIENKKNEKFLRAKTHPISPLARGGFLIDNKEYTRKDIISLIARMRKTMQLANGIGLSANQVGINGKFFIAKVPDAQGNFEFYAVFNPELSASGSGKIVMEEGCLSVLGKYGNVSRAERVMLKGIDKNGKPLRIKAWGLLARVFQHEVDHLNGKLFIDRTKDIHEVPMSERLTTREGIIGSN